VSNKYEQSRIHSSSISQCVFTFLKQKKLAFLPSRATSLGCFTYSWMIYSDTCPCVYKFSVLQIHLTKVKQTAFRLQYFSGAFVRAVWSLFCSSDLT